MKSLTFRGLKINVENDAGTVRSGISHIDGKPWSVTMTYPYGEIAGTVGMDGDPVDVFVGPNTSAKFVYVVHQLDKITGGWDEDKCFLGFDNAMDAKAAYYKNFDKPDQFYGSIETIPFKVFKEKLKCDNGAMIHAKGELTKGSPVTVDGMRGRGVIVAVDGDDVVVYFRNRIYIKRNKMYVHNMGDNMYKSRYVSAGGPGSGRHAGEGNAAKLRKKEAMETYQKVFKLAKQLGFTDAKAKEAAMDAYVAKHTSLEAGGPGSGRKPGYVKGLNTWKSDKQETHLARINPKQKSLLGPGHTAEIQKKVKEGKLAAAQVIQSPDLNVVTPPKGPNKTIKKVGTTFCVVSDGTDSNFGCYNSMEQAEAVLNGRSFISPDVPANLFAGNQLMPYGAGTTPRVKLKVPKSGHSMGIGHRKPNPSMKHGKGIGHRNPNPSFKLSADKKTIESFGDLGEPMAGALGHAHIEPEIWFHPPSEKNPTHVPVDDPNETDDRFLDVTKRKQAKKDRMARLKRSSPGGLPALIPAHTTLLAPHTAAYQPAMGFASSIKASRTSDKRIRVSYKRQGCL